MRLRQTGLCWLLGTTAALLSCGAAQGQDVGAPRADALSEVVIKASRRRDTISRLPDIQGTAIYAGKKSEVIEVASLDANLAEKGEE